ncbi:MAG: SDR family NAD(P)-dependent oxidoreductase [Chloroflexota bacterium]|nr:SDR family NAD(P)-dependent oxidoreductase [Chloroflexota bacterium]
MTTNTRPFAVVTGASSGIGYKLAQLCAENGFDLLIAADQPEINHTAQNLRMFGVSVNSLQADLATLEGVDKLYAAIQGRPVDALLANAGHGLGKAFLDQDFHDIRHVIDTNITGTVYLLHKVVGDMRARDKGRVLITGSIADHIPGAFQAVYHSSKAFVDSFAVALRNELKETQITVTCLQPGPTETEFFERADMLDTKVGQQKKADPADVAKTGFEAMMKGEGDVVSGFTNKVQVAMSGVVSPDRLAEQSRKINEPGSGKS